MNRAFLIFLTGIAVGIFIAPAKGSETFQKLMDGFNDLKDKVGDQADNLVNKGKETLEKGRNKVVESFGD